MERDLSRFNPKAPPRKTNAFWSIVDANRSPEEGELADALDALAATLDKENKQAQEMSPDKWPDAVTVMDIRRCANGDLQEWLYDRNNRRKTPHRMEKVGYVPVRNPDANDGAWKIKKYNARHTIYVKKTLPLRQTAGCRKQAGRGRDGRKEKAAADLFEKTMGGG